MKFELNVSNEYLAADLGKVTGEFQKETIEKRN